MDELGTDSGRIRNGFRTDSGLIQADYRWSRGGAILKGEAVKLVVLYIINLGTNYLGREHL